MEDKRAGRIGVGGGIVGVVGGAGGSSVSGGYKAPGAVAKDAGFGGIAGSGASSASTSALIGSSIPRRHHPQGGGLQRQMSASTIGSSATGAVRSDRQTDLDVCVAIIRFPLTFSMISHDFSARA